MQITKFVVSGDGRATSLRVLMTIAGLLLLGSGLTHVSQPYLFLYSVASYQILPLQVVGFMVLLPYAQVIVGFNLLIDWGARKSMWIASGLFSAFAAAQLIAIVRNQQISCGCFGFSESSLGVASLFWPVLGLSACAMGIWLLRRPTVSHQ